MLIQVDLLCGMLALLMVLFEDLLQLFLLYLGVYVNQLLKATGNVEQQVESAHGSSNLWI